MVDMKYSGTPSSASFDAAYVACLNARCEEFGITSEQLCRLADRTGATPIEIMSALARTAPSKIDTQRAR